MSSFEPALFYHGSSDALVSPHNDGLCGFPGGGLPDLHSSLLERSSWWIRVNKRSGFSPIRSTSSSLRRRSIPVAPDQLLPGTLPRGSKPRRSSVSSHIEISPLRRPLARTSTMMSSSLRIRTPTCTRTSPRIPALPQVTLTPQLGAPGGSSTSRYHELARSLRQIY